MLNWLAKLLLTSTAIAPVLLSYPWVADHAGEARQALALVSLVGFGGVLAKLTTKY